MGSEIVLFQSFLNFDTSSIAWQKLSAFGERLLGLGERLERADAGEILTELVLVVDNGRASLDFDESGEIVLISSRGDRGHIAVMVTSINEVIVRFLHKEYIG